MVWPWAGPVIRVRRINMSSVPCTISGFVGLLVVTMLALPLECLGENIIHHSNVYGKELLRPNAPQFQFGITAAFFDDGTAWPAGMNYLLRDKDTPPHLRFTCSLQGSKAVCRMPFENEHA